MDKIVVFICLLILTGCGRNKPPVNELPADAAQQVVFHYAPRTVVDLTTGAMQIRHLDTLYRDTLKFTIAERKAISTAFDKAGLHSFAGEEYITDANHNTAVLFNRAEIFSSGKLVGVLAVSTAYDLPRAPVSERPLANYINDIKEILLEDPGFQKGQKWFLAKVAKQRLKPGLPPEY